LTERTTVSAQGAAQDTESGERADEQAEQLIHRPDPATVTTPGEFAQALTTLREQTGMSIRELARITGTTSSTLGEWFAGRHLPPVSALVAVIGILDSCGVSSGASRQAWLDALARVRRLPGPRPADAPVPYRGLQSYRADDAGLFFGREALVARLSALVTTSVGPGATVMVGPSGAGKSSALAAGLTPRLRRSGMWEVVTITPGATPMATLDAALDRVRAARLAHGVRVALIVDQLEELFTICRSSAERESFVAAVTGPLEDPSGDGPGFTVVIALRADFYADALRYAGLSQAMQDRQVVVGPMSRKDLRRAITEPARTAGVSLDPGLVELVLHDVTPAPAVPSPSGSALPLMSFALLETYRRGRGARLTVEDYVAAGGLTGAVPTVAEAVYADLNRQQREATRRLFLRLVAVGDGVADTRRRATAAELGLDTPDGDVTSEVLERFVAAGLLTSDRTTVEIAHEALLVAWPRLRGWSDADRAGLVTRRRLADAALLWDRDGRQEFELHRGGDLISAREWATDDEHRAQLSPTEQTFLDTSVTAQERDRDVARSRTRRLRGLLAGITAVAVVGAGVAVVSRTSVAHERDRALSRELAAASDRLRGSDPSVAGQVAVLAWRTAQTAEARSALLDASATPLARRLEGPGGAAAVAVSGNGGVLAAVGDKGGLRVWTLGQSADLPATPTATVPDADPQGLDTVALNRAGDVAFAAGTTGVLHVWDTRDPRHPARLPDVPVTHAPVLGLAVSSDGRTLAAAGGDGKVHLYDVAGTRITPLGRPLPSGRDTAVQAVTFSADGKALAAGGSSGKVTLWTLQNRASPTLVPIQLSGPTTTIAALSFSPDGHRMLAGSRDQHLYQWSLATPTAAPTRWDDAGGSVATVAFSPDGALLAAGGSDQHLRVYETASRQLVADLPHQGSVTGAVYLPGGRGLLTGSADGTARLWPTPVPAAPMPVGRTVGLAYLDGDRLAAASSRNALRIFDVGQAHRTRPLGTAVAAPAGKGALAGTTAVSRTGSLIAAGGTDGTTWLFQAATTTGPAATRLLTALPRTQTGPVGSAALSPDGRTLITAAGDGTLQVTDVSTPAAPHPPGVPTRSPGVVHTLAFSPDGTTLAAGTSSPNTVLLWDVRDPAHLKLLAPPVTVPALGVNAVAFSADGHTLAVGAADRTVRLLDTTDRAHPHWVGDRLPGTGDDDVYAVAFTPDARTLGVAGGDGLVRLWDVSDRNRPALMATLGAGGDQPLYSLAFDRTGGRVAAGGAGTSVQQWDLGPSAATTWVCSVDGAPLGAQTWSRYLPGVPYATPCSD
jgi:WD40 repeat protein/DNA-binding transcriptional regulator YiaG